MTDQHFPPKLFIGSPNFSHSTLFDYSENDLNDVVKPDSDQSLESTLSRTRNFIDEFGQI